MARASYQPDAPARVRPGNPRWRVGLVSDRCGHRAGNASVSGWKGPTYRRGLGPSPTRGHSCLPGRTGDRARERGGQSGGQQDQQGEGQGWDTYSRDPPRPAGFVWRVSAAPARRAGFVLPAGFALGARCGFVRTDGLAIRRGGRGRDRRGPGGFLSALLPVFRLDRSRRCHRDRRDTRCRRRQTAFRFDRFRRRDRDAVPSAQDGRAVRPLRAGSAPSPGVRHSRRQAVWRLDRSGRIGHALDVRIRRAPFIPAELQQALERRCSFRSQSSWYRRTRSPSGDVSTARRSASSERSAASRCWRASFSSSSRAVSSATNRSNAALVPAGSAATTPRRSTGPGADGGLLRPAPGCP